MNSTFAIKMASPIATVKLLIKGFGVVSVIPLAVFVFTIIGVSFNKIDASVSTASTVDYTKIAIFLFNHPVILIVMFIFVLGASILFLTGKK